jgi:hypothetical protein
MHACNGAERETHAHTHTQREQRHSAASSRTDGTQKALPDCTQAQTANQLKMSHPIREVYVACVDRTPHVDR